MATSSLKSSLRTAVTVLAAVVMSMLFVAVPGAEATHDAEPVPGNPTCANLLDGEGWNEYKIEGQGGGDNEVAPGTYTDPDGPLEVTVTVDQTDDGWVLGWDANIGVDAVFVKGGDTGGHLYRYDPEATSDTGLHAPENPSEKYAGLSHISFCYDVEEQPADIGLSVDKVNDADGDGDFSDSEIAPAEGAEVPFSVTISNPDSDAAVVLDSATDVFADAEVDLFEECDSLSGGDVLAVGESVECTFTLADYAPAPGESLDNVVTVAGHEQGDETNTTSDQDDSTVTTPSQGEGPAAIGLTVDKVNDADGDDDFTDDETAPAEGADVPFSVEISNPADSEAAVVLDSATDAFADTEVDLFDECDSLSDSTVLEPGGSVTCTFTLADYAPAPGESLDNTVAVEGHEQGDETNTTSDQDDSTVDTASQEEGPAAINLVVDKVNDADGDGDFSDTDTAPAEDASVDFRVTISVMDSAEAPVVLSSAIDTYPTVDGDTSNDTTVDLFDECDSLSDSTVLEPGGSVTCTFTLVGYAPAAGESLDNTVSVAGHELENPDNTTSDQDDSTVETEADEVLGVTDERDEPTEAAQQPAIAVDKVALVSPGAAGAMTVTYVPDDGDEETVTYRYRVTNTGDTALDQVQLTDDVLGTVELADTTLEPGESTTATATHVLTEADAEAGSIFNVATAVGTAPDGEQVSATDDALVLVEAVQPAVEVADERLEQAPAEDQLPATGADPIGWSALALGLLVVGGAALLATRQRATA